MKRVIHLKEVSQRTGLSRSEIYRRIQKGLFPTSIHVGLNRVVWFEKEVDFWMKLILSQASQAEIKEALSEQVSQRMDMFNEARE